MAANLRPSGQTKTLPSPLGGWNTRDSLAMMQPTDAVTLENWWPRTSDMINRRGSAVFAYGMPSAVNTLMNYSGTAGQEFYACSGNAIYDITSGGEITSSVLSGLSSSAFQYTNFGTDGGQYLVAVSGSDDLVLYDGTTWTQLNSTTTPAITGVATSSLRQVNIWKKRLFFVENDSMNVWYLDTNSIAGTAHKLPMGSLFRKGGKIIATATWTLDAGYGADDHLVIITSRGEVAVYHGTDPANPAEFAMIGIYEIGAPVSDRCYVKFGGDLLLITLDGIVPLSKALTSTRIDNRIAISDKIGGAMTEATSLYQDNFGWQGMLFPKVNMLLFNIPLLPNVEAAQFVMNTLTGAWAKFTGWNSNCFELFNDDLYFGSSGTVYKAWTGLNDNGTQITAICKQAFNYFDSPAQLKHWKMARPIFFANMQPLIQINMDVDFDDEPIYSIPSVVPVNFSVGRWDVSDWDNSTWSSLQVYKYWQTLSKLGYTGAFKLLVTGDSLDCTWASTDFLFEFGGVI